MTQPNDTTEHRRKYRAEWMRNRRASAQTMRKLDRHEDWACPQGTNHAPPPDVAAERDRAYGAPQGRTAELMGDPPPGRSALEKRTTGPLPQRAGPGGLE
jgi:hypothetical protein